METEKRRRRRSRAWLWLLVLIPLIYLGVQVYISSNRPYRTQTAQQVTLTDSVEVHGVVVRSETVIPQQTAGVVGDIAQDMQRVSQGTEVARIFDSETAAQSFASARRLDSRISALQKAQTDGSNAGTDVELVLKQVNSDLYSLISLLGTGNYSGLTAVRDELNYSLNKLDVAVGKTADYSALIAQLEQQRDALDAQGVATASVAAPQTGYYFYDVDGYESLTPDAVAAMDADALDALLAAPVQGDTAGSVGKMVGSYRWYYACTVDADTAARFVKGDSVTLNFTDAGVTGLAAVVTDVSDPVASGRVKVTLSCQLMESGVSALRFETAEIEFATYTGIRINRSALHINAEGETGVFVKFGTLVRFCRITPIFETDTYILVPTTPYYPTGDDDTTPPNEVELYDEILVEGSDLYDGKLL